MRLFRNKSFFTNIAFALALLFLFSSCTTMLNLIGPGDKRKGVVFAQVLQSIEADYQVQIKWPDLTAAEKDLLRGKRTTLVNAFFGGKDMVAMIDENKPVPENLLNELFRWLNELQRGALRPIPQSYAVGPQAAYAVKAQNSWTNAEITKALKDAGMFSSMQIQMDPVLLGTLIELFRASLHFAIIIIEMRNSSDEQVDALWSQLSVWLKEYDPASLPSV